MALHFSQDEFTGRLERLKAAMKEEKLDAILLFAQESMYWLTGYDTFGYCFFQTLVVKADGSMVLLTRSADLRQARHTSNIERIEIWVDRVNADPTMDLKNLLSDLDLCTYADEERFFSYRRTTHRNEPDYGRQISAIFMREE